MELQKINAKIYFARPDAIRVADFIQIFNSWIQASDGVYYDLADYSHVADGPGILLIAHEANISIDGTGGRLGLLYNHKGPLQGTNENRLGTVLRAALEYCAKLEAEPSLRGEARFSGNETMLIINDRLIAPNSEVTFDALKGDLESFGRKLFMRSDFTLERRHRDRRRRFAVDFKSRSALDVSALRRNLTEA